MHYPSDPLEGLAFRPDPLLITPKTSTCGRGTNAAHAGNCRDFTLKRRRSRSVGAGRLLDAHALRLAGSTAGVICFARDHPCSLGRRRLAVHAGKQIGQPLLRSLAADAYICIMVWIR